MVEILEVVKEEYEKYLCVGIVCVMKNSGVGVGIFDVGRCRLVIKDGKVYIRISVFCIG